MTAAAPIRLVCLGMGALLSGGAGASAEGDVLGLLGEGRLAPVQGATETLAELHAAGLAVCLTGRFPPAAQAALIERLGWTGLVDLALSAGDGLRDGPHPDLVLTALLRLGVDDVRQVAVAGGTVDELVGGHRAGAGVVAGILAGGLSRAELISAPHTHVLESVHDLLAVVAPAAGARRFVAEETAPKPPAEGSVILDVGDLSIYYGTTRAVNSLSLQVMRGEIFGLLGPNGAGKTSTLSAIEGLLRPRSGTIVLDGIDVGRRPIDARVRMGVQLQATSFQTNLTLRQIVRLYGGLYGLALSEREVVDVLAGVGLEADIGKEFKQLSGGQKQRLSLQIAVIHQPALLLLDEPTAGLDPQARRQLWARIEHLRERGGSILLTTHSMEEAQAVCDRVAIIDNGALLTCGSPHQLIERHQDDPKVLAVAHGEVTLDDVFVGLTGTAVRD